MALLESLIGAGVNYVGSRVGGSDCMSEAQMGSQVGGAPCPGQIPTEIVERAIQNAPTAARLELLEAFRANNPWWCGQNLPSAFAIAKAAAGGGDCRMSRDRGNLVATLQRFVSQWTSVGSAPGGWPAEIPGAWPPAPGGSAPGGNTGSLPPWSIPQPGGGGTSSILPYDPPADAGVPTWIWLLLGVGVLYGLRNQ